MLEVLKFSFWYNPKCFGVLFQITVVSKKIKIFYLFQSFIQKIKIKFHTPYVINKNWNSNRFADLQEAEGSDGQTRHYNHPFLQSNQMFLGMLLNLVLYKIVYHVFKRQSVSIIINLKMVLFSQTKFYIFNFSTMKLK